MSSTISLHFCPLRKSSVETLDSSSVMFIFYVNFPPVTIWITVTLILDSYLQHQIREHHLRIAIEQPNRPMQYSSLVLINTYLHEIGKHREFLIVYHFPACSKRAFQNLSTAKNIPEFQRISPIWNLRGVPILFALSAKERGRIKLNCGSQLRILLFRIYQIDFYLYANDENTHNDWAVKRDGNWMYFWT